MKPQGREAGGIMLQCSVLSLDARALCGLKTVTGRIFKMPSPPPWQRGAQGVEEGGEWTINLVHRMALWFALNTASLPVRK
jgi:hypothetical protein